MENAIMQLQSILNIDSADMNYYAAMAIKILFIIVVGRISITIISRFIMKFFKFYPKLKMEEKKFDTLAGILKSIVKYTIYIIMTISVLNVLSIPTATILATAGIGGIAIGFGAQSLVKDVFAGFFILFEDQYKVGDYITIENMTGTVEDIGLRITKLRSFNGDLHIIPNGEVKTVTNHSRGNSLAIIDTAISYGTDSQKAMEVLEKLAEQYYKLQPEGVIEKPEVLGIIKLNESDVVIRTIARTKPLSQWKIEREFRLRILEAFKENGIEIPYRKRIILDKEEA